MTHESSLLAVSSPLIAPRAIPHYQILFRVIGPFLGIGAKPSVLPRKR